MSKWPFSFFQNVVTGSGGTKCASVTITPTSGPLPSTVNLSTTQTGGHIFYRISTQFEALHDQWPPPVHNGDNAGADPDGVIRTVRIGSNNGTILVSGGTAKNLTALCYQAGFLDSDVTQGGQYMNEV